MKQYPLLFAFCLIGCCVAAQEGAEWKEASKESHAYHEFRVTLATPPYGLAKVKKLVSGIKEDGDGNMKLSPKIYQALSLREKFTYHMINFEAYAQICDAMPPIQDEEKKIFGHLPSWYEDYGWDDRQLKFFIANRDSVMKLMKECIQKNNQVGLNFKKVMVEINATEMIPFLITVYNTTKKDRDILTVFMLLMHDNNYEPFMVSTSNRKLYGQESDYQSYLTYNKANEDLIIQRATDFYNGIGK